MPAVGLDPSDTAAFETLMWAAGSGVDVEMDNMLELVYQNYQTENDGPGICVNAINSTHCAFSNLTYNQWLSSAVLKTPMPDQTVKSLSYVNNYAPYSQLAVSPEMS